MRHSKNYLIICLLSTIIMGCAVGPDFHSPKAPQTKRYTETQLPAKTVQAATTGGAAQHFVDGQDIPAAWWTLFQSSALDELIREGIANSPNLQAAQAALRQAQENLRAQIGFSFFPAIGAQGNGQRQKFSEQSFGVNQPSQIFNLYNASVNISYVPDVFGGARRQVEASRALVDYQRYETEATYLALTANIVTAAINEASLHAQIEATKEIVALQSKQLEISKKQLEVGAVSGLDVLAQGTQLEQTRATIPVLEKSLSQTRNALSVLVGALPSERNVPKFELDSLHLPTQLPVSLPSNLVRQRPDVQAAEALLHQASAQVGVATAQLCPQFTLGGNYGFESGQFGNLFKASSAIWSLSAAVAQPIFNGGSLLAKRRAAIAAYEQSLAQYRQTVLQAFQNVADTLRALETDARALKSQAEAERLAKKTLIMTQEQYRLGAVDYVTLLLAQRAYMQTKIARIQTQALRYADTAALFQALGGGWWNREQESK